MGEGHNGARGSEKEDEIEIDLGKIKINWERENGKAVIFKLLVSSRGKGKR